MTKRMYNHLVNNLGFNPSSVDRVYESIIDGSFFESLSIRVGSSMWHGDLFTQEEIAEIQAILRDEKLNSLDFE